MVASNRSALCQAVYALHKRQSRGNVVALSKILRSYVSTDSWVHIPTNKGSQLSVFEDAGRVYAALYSDPAEIKSRRHSHILHTGINKLLQPVYASTEIDGVVIDPDTTALYVEKPFLLKCILHGGFPTQDNGGGAPRDWGDGIPRHVDTDRMTEGELLNFAIQCLLHYEEQLSDWNLVSSCDYPLAIPQLVFEREGKFLFVAVKGYCASETPVLTEMERESLLEQGQRFAAVCYYAPVGFLSVDADRASANLALRGDGFHAIYNGLEQIS